MTAPTSPDRVSAPSTPVAAAPTRRPRRRPAGAPPGTRQARVAVLARVALVPAIVTYGVAVVLAGVVTALASGVGAAPVGDLSRALAVGVPLWLAAHLVPLQLGGVPLGLLPLAPALALVLLVARVARTAAERLGGGPTTAGAPVVATAAAAHAVIGVLAAALLAPETVVDASPGAAGVVAGLIAGCGALAGVAGPCGAARELGRLPDWVRHGLRTGLLAAAVLLCAGSALLLAALLADAPAVAAVLDDTAPQAGSGAGLTLLSALYLPNAVVAAASWLCGPGLTLGLSATSPSAVTALAPGARPPIPLLALLPDAAPPSWAVLVFAVPLAVGSAVGWWLSPTSPDPYRRLRSVLVAAVVAAVALGLLAVLAGGHVGHGPIDPVVVPSVALAAAVLGWIAVPGATVAVLASPPGTPRRAPSTRARRRGPAPAPVPAATSSGEPDGETPAVGEGTADDTADDVTDDTADDVTGDTGDAASTPTEVGPASRRGHD